MAETQMAQRMSDERIAEIRRWLDSSLVSTEIALRVGEVRALFERIDAVEQRFKAAERERDLALSTKRAAETRATVQESRAERAEERAELADASCRVPGCVATGEHTGHVVRLTAASVPEPACHCVRGPSSVIPSQSCPVHGWTPANRKG